LENVKKEKMIEMWLEGCRFQDLVRWGDTDELMANGKSYPNFKDKIMDGNATHEGYVDYSDADWCVKQYPSLGFKKGQHELFPFPFSETSVNENIVQNPGW
ncbi:MAG: RagB/SusD family nutrient uptake outer membrane protein, partial [Bacteroidales bacterium]|nr:RagB/SusD family nutrient uptake outer membrane protein [Bacteroidales bacterium]